MDKVKQQLAIAMKYGFWIGCVCVFIGSLAVWWMSTSRLEQENSSQVSTITNDIQKVTNLRGELDTQPNETSHKEMNGLIAERTDEVLDAWKKIYEDQLDILTWPKELKESYIDEFRYVRDEETGQLDKTRRKLPFEVYVEYDNELHEVAPTIRVSYSRYIKNVLADIAAIAKAEWTAEFDSRAGGGMDMDMGMGMEMDMGMGARAAVDITGVVDEPLMKWSTASQDAVLSDLFPWRGDRPTTLQVYYSQENLWILKQLLQIIATVNGNAQMPFEAKIREIQQLRIGESVKLEGIGAIAKPGDGMRGMGMGGGMGMDDMGMDDMDMGDMGMDMGGMGVEVELPDPGDNRYVDTENKPILGAALRSALTSKQPADAPLAVAKRIPVMMSVQIDQRYVPELIAACGSAPLMVEVKQTRILPKGTGASGMGGGMDMGMDMGMDDMDMGMGMGGMGGGMGAMQQGPADEFPLDMQVEIYGLIHLYNPPDEDALGVKQVNQDTPVVEAGSLPAPSATAPAAVDPDTTPANPATQPPAATDAPGASPLPAGTVPATPGSAAPGNPAPGNETPPAAGPAVPEPAPTAMAIPN